MPAPVQLSFKYQSLADPAKEIRLLRLLRPKRGRSRSTLQCQLFHTNIESAEPYVALSYEWGQPGSTANVLVNDTSFTVQKNLLTFLQQIHRHKLESLPLTLWVDAICINQSSASGNTEKNHQLKLMGKIYSQARTVLVWLGELSKDAVTIASEYLGCCTSHYDALMLPMREHVDDEDHDHTGYYMQVYKTRWLFYDMNRSSGRRFRDIYVAFKTICAASYWTRLWMVQEIILSNSIEVFTGELTFPETYLHLMSSFLEVMHYALDWKPYDKSSYDQKSQLKPKSMHEFFRGETRLLLDVYSKLTATVCEDGGPWLSRGQKLPLSHYFGESSYSYLQCTDTHDRVYALLGVVSEDIDQRPFEVNYNKSLVDLLVQVVAHFSTDRPIDFARTLKASLQLGRQSDRGAEAIEYSTW